MMSATSLPVILFIGVNPTDTRRLRLDDEAKRIKQALRDRKDQLTFVSEGAVTADALRQHLLEHNPRVVHMSGHALTAGFKFENPQGTTALIRTDSLVDLFKLCGASTQCVVLNACYSEAHARAIAQHVDVVIGMATAVPDWAAIAFAGAFYQALGNGEDVQNAFDLGRLEVAFEAANPCAQGTRDLPAEQSEAVAQAIAARSEHATVGIQAAILPIGPSCC